jgi:hypothetical protein
MSVKTRFASRGVAAFAAGVAGLLAFAAVPALAVTGGPQWTVTSVSSPTNFKPGDESGEDSYKVIVTNTGGGASDGSPVVMTDELPQGLSLDPAGASGEDTLARINHPGTGGANFSCALRTCIYTGTVVPDEALTLTFPVDVSAEAPSSVTNVIRVSGGGAPGASMSTPTAISSTPAGFGISPGGSTTALSSVQAGAHPDLTTSIAFNTVNRQGSLAGDPKDTTDELPPGFAGDLVDTPSCPVAKFQRQECAIGTQVGVTTLTLQRDRGRETFIEPVYNLSPSPGEVSKLGFPGANGLIPVQGGVSLRPGDYGLSATFHNINQGISELDNVSLTVWGVPADSSHDPLRWNGLFAGGAGHFGASSDAAPAPFLTNPTACGTGPLRAAFLTDSWQQPGQFVEEHMPFGPMVGCDRLTIEPSLTVETTTSRAYSPSGLDLGMTIPQTYDNAFGLATSTLKRAVVALPEGMTVNPSAGAGLAACTEVQLAQEGAQFVAGAGCPNESKLGEVTIVSPAIKEAITGSVFLASPAPNGESGRNPFNSLLALYIVARLPDRGIIIKAAGEVTADPSTGRLVTTFDNLPPLPFSTFTFKFHSGATAPLVTPPGCGLYTAQAALTPLANPEGAPLTPLVPPFPITSAFDGGACPSGGVPPFAPQVSAGTLNNNAGSYSPLYIRIGRNDGEQEITGFGTQLPPGLTGNLNGIPFCGEAEIAAAHGQSGAQSEVHPACPAASQIGHTIAEAGVGTVLAQTPGKLYLGGPYQGAPFSVVSVTSAKVGPFDLGTVVVHLPLQINPETAAVTIPSGAANQIPHIIKGIVIHLRTIRVYIDRAHFMLNPTSCDRMGLGATVIGGGADPTNPADNTPVTVNDPFQAADCANLSFAPKLAVSTAAKASRGNGASLSFHIAYPAGAVGSESWFHYAKFVIPKQLSARLTTLQKACLARVFEKERQNCPAASIIGHALVHTPILPVPLEGPVYFVSYGGAAFPDAVLVLHGYGVTVELHGHTLIEHGVTSATFNSLPDTPFESIEVTVPQGQFSEFGANLPHEGQNFCGQKLTMATEFKASNGLQIKRNTPVGVTGCPKGRTNAKKLTAALKACRKKHGKKRAACEKAAHKAHGARAPKRQRAR